MRQRTPDAIGRLRTSARRRCRDVVTVLFIRICRMSFTFMALFMLVQNGAPERSRREEVRKETPRCHHSAI